MELNLKDLNDEIKSCQNILYRGYNRTDSSGISWLNDFCGCFLKFCNKLQYFISTKDLDENLIEIIFLAVTQTVSCIKYMEKLIQLEDSKDVSLTSTRQHFLDRILWCLARIKSVIISIKDDVRDIAEEINCIDLMDNVLDMIAPYTKSKESEKSLSPENMNNINSISNNVRTTINAMLSQILAFANVALPQDKRAITAFSQRVLKECIEFQEQCSTNPASNKHNWNFQAILLENSILQLEECINESLLRMVFKIFADYSQFSFNELRTKINLNPATNSSVDDKIADFDINLDRIFQIGIFAIAFASNVKVRTTIRNCLASLESLDSCLIPSIYSHCDLHSTLLEEHYHEEMKKFQKTVQGIIDTVGFCTSYIDILTDGIKASEKEFNKNELYELLEMTKVLKEHFEINSDDLKIYENNSKEQKFNNVLLMINECQAILACADQIDPLRVIKRFKILRTTVSKLKELLDTNSKNRDKNRTIEDLELLAICDDSKKTRNLLETFQITATKTSSIFYKSRQRGNITDSLKANYSKMSNSDLKSSIKVRRKLSLRTAMFKRQKSIETANLFNSYNENSTNLHITDILDEITFSSSANRGSSQ